MNLYTNSYYLEDIAFVANLPLSWERFHNKSVMLSGATGLIGSFLIDVILKKNATDHCTIYALGRNKSKAKVRFQRYVDDLHFVFIPYDVTLPFEQDTKVQFN